MKASKYIYVIAGLIVGYILLSKRSKIPDAIKTGQTWFSTIWEALVKPAKGGINGGS